MVVTNVTARQTEIPINRGEMSDAEERAPALVNVVSSNLFGITNSACMVQGVNFQPGVRTETNGLKMQVNAGIQNLTDSFQKDFDRGWGRAPAYIYGPGQPLCFFAGVKFMS